MHNPIAESDAEGGLHPAVPRSWVPAVRRCTRFAALPIAAFLCTSSYAHHSFAMFDTSKTMQLTGIVARVNPDANHLQIFFAVMNDERRNVLRDNGGQPILWVVEMAGAAQAAHEGISVASIPPGLIISVSLHPVRTGAPAGSRVGPMFKCPARTPPAPGKHCDSVAGHVALGGGS